MRLPVIVLLGILGSNFPALAQTRLSADDIVQGLRGLDEQAQISAPALHERAVARIRAKQVDNPNGRPDVAEELNRLPQLTVEINFHFDSAVIDPKSYVALGRIADALWHPALLEYRILVVGHTDASGKREYNLKLSQRRADAIREALTTTFRIPARRVTAVGLGEEQLQDKQNPRASVNRRVQLVAVGKL